MQISDFLTIKEFADHLGVHPDTIRRSIKRGRITAVRLGAGKRAIYRIPKSEINRLAFHDMEKILDQIIEKRLQEKRNLL